MTVGVRPAGGVGGGSWVERLARPGLAAKGVLYAIIGVLALMVAVGAGGKTTDNGGALTTLADKPFGKALVAILAVGLAGYVAWRLAQAFADTDDKGDDASGLVKRAGKIVGAVAYGILLGVAISILVGSGGSSGSSGGSKQEKQTTAGVLDWPAGRYLVGIAGLVVIGVGAWNVYRGLSRKFMKRLRVSGPGRPWVERTGVVGHVARGVVFGLIGVFLVKAAVEFDPKEAVGLDGALARLADRAYGPVLLGIVAAGLIAYALFCFAEARWREV